MPLRTRRWNDPPEPGDGLRILVCRYRPRALPKANETWDVWKRDLGPSVELHADYYGKRGRPPIGWDEYRARYVAEMGAQERVIAALAAAVAAGKTITLLCSSACTDERRCHRGLLAALVQGAAERGA